MKRLANLAVVMIMLISGVTARAQHFCSPSSQQAAAQSVKIAQEHLLYEKVEGLGFHIKPQIISQLVSFKHSLSAAVQYWMVCHPESSTSASALQNRLAKWLGANKPVKPMTYADSGIDQPADNIYGADLKISARKLHTNPDFLAIQTGFGIPCGDDNQLMLYERNANHWKHVLLWQSRPYKKISGAFGDFFDYVLLPPTVAGKWELAAAHGMPWCTSRFSAFDVDLLQISASGKPQRLIFHYNKNYSRGSFLPRLSATRRGFQVRIATPSLDYINQYVKTSIYRFRVQKDKVRRVQPIATNPVGFVDAWLQAKWPEARYWSAPGQRTKLQKQYTALQASWNDGYPEFIYQSTRSCSNTPGNYQVQLQETFYQKQNMSRIKRLYFLTHKANHTFTMVAISSQAYPSCNGPNTLKIHQ